MKEIIFLNGRFLPAKEAVVSAVSPGLLLGWGVFETMRSCKNKIILLDAHLKRLFDSCASAGIKPPYPAAGFKKIIQETVGVNGFKDSYVRLTLSKAEKGVDITVMAKKYTPYPREKRERGLSACIVSGIGNCQSASLKATSRIFLELAFREAKVRGLEEAIIADKAGYICEGTRSNIFIAKDKRLFTPDLSCGCLDGITRRAILGLSSKFKIDFKECLFSIQGLYNAQEAFLTNSLMGVMPLTVVEKQKIGNGRPGPLTGLFMEKYNLLIK